MFEMKQYQKEAVAAMLTELVTENTCDNMSLSGFTFSVAGDGHINQDNKYLVDYTIYYIFRQGEYAECGPTHHLDLWGELNTYGGNFKHAYTNQLRGIFGDDHILENEQVWADLIHSNMQDLGEETYGQVAEWYEDEDIPEGINFGISIYNGDVVDARDIVRWFFKMT